MLKKLKVNINTLKLPLLFVIIFYSIAIWRYLATGSIFYIFNFGYIGTSLAVGIFLNDALPREHILWGRRIAQLLIGSYLLLYVGFINKENMQIEGFFFYLFSGIFAGATLHYFIAKIAGPVIFNRGWCGWACWTAMVLDFLPWKRPADSRPYKGVFRYLHLLLSLLLVLFFWFVLKTRSFYNESRIELYWLFAGNLVYYISGIIVAVVKKDNRAFCKYICPIPVLQKGPARFSLLKIEINPEKCIECGICENNCPMGIHLLDYMRAGTRINSTECILCSSCINLCKAEAIQMSFKIRG